MGDWKELTNALLDDRGAVRRVGTTWRMLFSVIDDIDKHVAKTGNPVNDVELTGAHISMCTTILMPRLADLAKLRGASVTRRLNRKLICIGWPDGRGINVHIHPYDIKNREMYLRRYPKFVQSYHDHYWEA